MKQFNTLFKKEFVGYFLSYAAYFIVGVYLFLTMVTTFYLGGYFETHNTDLYSFFYFQPQVLLLIVPALAMWSWSEDKKNGTFEVVLSYPVSYGTMVLAKFFASFAISALMISLTVPLWIYSAQVSLVDNLTVLSAYIGVLFIAALFCSISCFISSTNSSPIVSYLLSVFVIWLVVSIDYNFIIKPISYASDVIFINIQGALNFGSHYNSFVTAQIGIDNFIYFITLIMFILILNKIIIEDRKDKSWIGVSFVGFLFVIAFILANVLSSMLFSTVKIDMTSDGKYSLSKETKEIVSNLNEKIDIKVYVSNDIRKISPVLADYSKYVLNYLEKYKDVSKGMINIDVRTTERYSLAEREAKENGVTSIVSNNNDDLIYFGAVISGSSGKSHTINIFLPERMQYLERDISRAVYKLANNKKKKIGWVNSSGTKDFDELISTILQENYEVVNINPNELEIPESIDTLVVVNLQRASRFLSYAIDQHLMRGKNVLTFVDNVNPQQNNKEFSIYAPVLLDKWGIEYDTDLVIADNFLAGRKITDEDNNKRVINDILSINVTKDFINQNNPITKNLINLSFNSPSYIDYVANDERKSNVLIETSAQSGAIERSIVTYNNDKMLNEAFIKSDEQHSLALLVEGKSRSIFDENILRGTEFEKDMRPFLIISHEPAKLLVVADTDMLNVDNWNYFGDKISMYSLLIPNNNLDFVIRAVDYLTDNSLLLGIGSKNISTNDKNLSEKIYQNVLGKYFDEMVVVDETIFRKEVEISDLTLEINNQFSMAKVKELEGLNRELIELKERSKYINYMISSEAKQKIFTIVFWFSMMLPILCMVLLFATIFIYRKIKNNKVLEIINEG